jgi:hypothetical protein
MLPVLSKDVAQLPMLQVLVLSKDAGPVAYVASIIQNCGLSCLCCRYYLKILPQFLMLLVLSKDVVPVAYVAGTI